MLTPYQQRAAEFVRGLPKDALIIWFTEYPEGLAALHQLGAELLRQDKARKLMSDAAQAAKGSCQIRQ